MYDTIFKHNSLGWRSHLLQQRIQEWWEWQLSRLADQTSDLSGLDLDAEWIKILIKFLLWSITAATLVWLTWQLWLLLRPYVRTWQKQQQQSQPLSNQYSVRELSVNEWLEKSQTFQKQRDYRQAIFCLYQAMLQQLSDRGILDNLSSRTDREYLKLIQQFQISSFPSYQLLLNTHEQLCFSNQEADESLWQKCQQDFQLIINN
ncbi:MAG: DUF4129 domain-containing protein [Xenococcus sp. MO_188.B8]|nr:DUF4129 domain-containing protein [Xenococcus sp. MO_188.B8]